ncbi:MAG TPA: hypothetical protein VFV08_00720, partial [Puia sp.]|nr:hypothetical protein [Puia sp.]
MKRKFFFGLALLLCTLITAAQTITILKQSATNPTGFVLLKPTGYDPSNTYTLWVFLHGVGGRGPGTDSSLYNLAYGLPNGTGGRYDPELPKELQLACQQQGFVLLAPQTAGDWGTAEVDNMVAWAKSNLAINWSTNRNVITGLSLGGGGTWRYISSSVARANNFATAI